MKRRAKVKSVRKRLPSLQKRQRDFIKTLETMAEQGDISLAGHAIIPGSTEWLALEACRALVLAFEIDMRQRVAQMARAHYLASEALARSALMGANVGDFSTKTAELSTTAFGDRTTFARAYADSERALRDGFRSFQDSPMSNTRPPCACGHAFEDHRDDSRGCEACACEAYAVPNRAVQWEIKTSEDFIGDPVLRIRGIDSMRWVVTEFSIRPEEVLSLRAALNEWDRTHARQAR